VDLIAHFSDVLLDYILVQFLWWPGWHPTSPSEVPPSPATACK